MGRLRNIYVQAEASQRQHDQRMWRGTVRFASKRRQSSFPVSEFAEGFHSRVRASDFSHYNLYERFWLQGSEAIGKSSGTALAFDSTGVPTRSNFSTTSAMPFTGLGCLCSFRRGSASVVVFGFRGIPGGLIFGVLSAQIEKSYGHPGDQFLMDRAAWRLLWGAGLSGIARFRSQNILFGPVVGLRHPWSAWPPKERPILICWRWRRPTILQRAGMTQSPGFCDCFGLNPAFAPS